MRLKKDRCSPVQVAKKCTRKNKQGTFIYINSLVINARSESGLRVLPSQRRPVLP